jgi:hypothetical protein
MAKSTSDGGAAQNDRGSSREYPKSAEAGYCPGKNIAISASDLSAKNLGTGVTASDTPRKRL